MKKYKTIGLLGPYGYGNLGDAAIQEANIYQLKSFCPRLLFVGISLNPGDTERRHGIKSFHYDSFNFAKFIWFKPGALLSRIELLLLKSSKLRIIAPLANAIHWRLRAFRLKYVDFLHWIYVASRVMKLNTLIISGGGQLDESWGGAEVHPYSIYKWCKTAQIFSVDIVFQSVGVGVISSAKARSYLTESLALARYVSYRDNGSYKLVTDNLKNDFHGKMIPDLAFGYDIKKQYLMRFNEENIKRIAIGPVAYCSNTSGWHEKDADRYLAYLEKITQLCSLLLLSGYHVTFIVGDISADRIALTDILERLRSDQPKLLSTKCSIPDIQTVDDLLISLSNVDLVVASRFHGVLLSFLLHKPVLALSFERKINQLMNEASLSEYCEDIEDFNPINTHKKIDRLWQEKDEISGQVKEYVTQSRKLVATQAEQLCDQVILA